MIIRRLGLVAALVASVALPACSDDEGGPGAPAPVGPPPASKQEAAQQLTEASGALNAALGEVQGGAKTKSVGLSPQANVSANVTGSCAGGGTISAQVTANSDTTSSGGAQQTTADVSYTITASGCKTANGYTIDGGPLSLNAKASSSTSASDGGISSSVQTTSTYSGSLTITGPLNVALSYSNLSLSADVAISSGNGATTGNVKVVLNGSVSVNGSTFSYANETVEVKASR